MMKKRLLNLSCILEILRSTMVLQMKQSFARPMFRFCLICNPIVNTVFLYELFLQRGIDAFLSHVVLGAGLMGIWSCICFSSVGDINRERYSGTLPLIYTAPGGFGIIVLGKILGNTLLSLFTFILSFITAGIISGRVMSIENVGYFCLSMGMTILGFMIVSVCFAYILMLSRKTELYMNLLEIPLIFLCGFTYPVEVLPKWVQAISNCLAPTWAVRMIRMSVAGLDKAQYFSCFYILIAELLVLLAVTYLLYRWVDVRIRIKATLEVS